MARIALITCARWPALFPGDAALAAALVRRGHVVEVAPWNGPEAGPPPVDLAVIRATWDYHEDLPAYRRWLHLARTTARRVVNAPALVEWNLDKRYLGTLAARGIRVPVWEEVALDSDRIARALDARGWDRAVLKPAIGASGVGVGVVERGRVAEALDGLRSLADRPFLLQEFVPEVVAGELAGVFLGGAYSHGLRRVPAPGEFRVNTRYGGTMEAAALDPATVAAMAAALGALPLPAVYARVDGVRQGEAFLVMEVEVNEPALGLHLVAGAAERFADALEACLESPA